MTKYICADCLATFDSEELVTIMVDGIGSTYEEVKVCPYCESEDYSEE